MCLNVHNNRHSTDSGLDLIFFFNYKKSGGRFPFIVDGLKDRMVMPTTMIPITRKTQKAGETSIWLIP